MFQLTLAMSFEKIWNKGQKTIHKQHFSMKKNEIELRVHINSKTVPLSFHSQLFFVSELFLTWSIILFFVAEKRE